ncbi:NEW3 domain-containing protein [Actibacterium sp. D379-3]
MTSNKVETIVQQVAGVTLTSNNSEEIAPGGKAFLPHIITNDGNGPDAFSLSAAEGTGDFDFTSVTFYPDADMDGVADSATPITETPTLAAGERFGVVIDATAPSTAAAGDAETLAIAAISLLDGAVTSANTDTLTVSSGAIMELVKSMVVDKSGGNPAIVDAGDTVEITLTYSNTGLAASTNYAVEDVIDLRLPYTVASAQWSDRAVAGGLDETNGTGIDATNGSGETIVYQVNAASNTIDFTVSNVDPGRTGKVTFEVTIGSLAEAGLIENTATQSDNTGNYPPSNTASVTVDSQYAHVIDDTFTQSDTTVVRSLTDDGAAGDDVVTETSDASQGGTIAFEFVVGNDSNQTDSYTLDVVNGDFPDGTTFRFVAEDGATPIVGSVGPLAAGDATKVTLLATLPTDAAPAAAGTTNFTATVSAISEGGGATNTSAAEFAGAVLAAAVDLENRVGGSEGDGAAPTNGADPWVTTATDPGQAVSFPMKIENLGPTADSYNLSLDQALPAGWTVEFQLADGTVVTNTGTIPSGSTADITVVVTPPADALPLTQAVDVKVTSPVSGQSDRIVNAVTVNEIVDVSIVASQTVQAAPGGVVDILHTITNDGNIDITEGAILESGLSDFSGAIYWDQNGDGVLDASDPIVDNFNDLTNNIGGTTAGLAAGDTMTLIYRVQAGSTPGVSEVGTLELGDSLNGATKSDADTANNAVSDRIVIVSGDVTLVKTQAIDPLCSGATGTFSKDRQDVEPGQCIRYRVVASNTGTAPVDAVVIKDVVPAYTALETCGTACDATAEPAGTSTVTTAAAPRIESTHGVLDPGSTATLEFTVKVDE